MSQIKLKDLLKEINTTGFVSRNPWIKEEDDTPSINIKELVSSINNYGSLGEQIYGKGSLKEVAETVYSQGISLPSAYNLTLEEQEYIIEKILEFYK